MNFIKLTDYYNNPCYFNIDTIDHIRYWDKDEVKIVSRSAECIVKGTVEEIMSKIQNENARRMKWEQY